MFSSSVWIAYLAIFGPPNNSGNHNTARTVPQKDLLGSSSHLSTSFIVFLFGDESGVRSYDSE